METTIYQFSVEDGTGKNISLSEYEGKVLVVVNVASKCGLRGQYEDLKELQEEFGDEKFTVLAFPSNQFMNQEPGTNDEIQETCELVFGVNFPVFGKLNVRGKAASPLYKYLTDKTNGFGGSIKWNFTKFLIDQNGKIVERLGPKINPLELRTKIEKLLEK